MAPGDEGDRDRRVTPEEREDRDPSATGAAANAALATVSDPYKVLGLIEADADGDHPTGVLGRATGTGATYGVQGITDSKEGAFSNPAGVYGEATTTVAEDARETFGVHGVTHTDYAGGAGVRGEARHTGGYAPGVYGSSEGSWTAAAGVKGFMENSDGDGSGVYGRTKSTEPRSAGVRGVSSHSGRTLGVYGEANSGHQWAAGVRGDAHDGLASGVHGRGKTSSAVGVYAENNSGGTALRIDGPVDNNHLGASVYHSSSQTISSGSYNTVTFDTEVVDDNNEFHNSSTFSPASSGAYHVDTTVQWNNVVSGTVLYNEIAVDGSGVAQVQQTADGDHSASVSKVLRLTAGENVTIRVYQNTGSSLDLEAGEQRTTRRSPGWGRPGPSVARPKGDA